MDKSMSTQQRNSGFGSLLKVLLLALLVLSVSWQPQALQAEEPTLTEEPTTTEESTTTEQDGTLQAIDTPRKTLVLLVNFKAGDTPIGKKTVQERVFGTANAYLREVSFGKTSLVGIKQKTGDIGGWFTVDAPDCYGYKWISAAYAAAYDAGYDVRSYDHIMYVFASDNGCGDITGAYLTSSTSFYTAKTIRNEGTVERALGNNFGFENTEAARCTNAAGQPVPISDTCTFLEMTDPFDVMGTNQAYHYNNFYKAKLGWIPAARVKTVTSNGEYTLTIQEKATNATQLIRIPAASRSSQYYKSYYALELRTRFGFDDFAADAAVVKGVTVRLAGGASVKSSLLLDAHPETRTFNDAPISVGQTITLAPDGVQIKLVSLKNGVARVKVSFK